MINYYVESLKNSVLTKISVVINEKDIEDLVLHDLCYHIDPRFSSRKFHQYYFRVTANRENFIQDPEFFRHFKYQYSLQGIDNNLLNKLESNKKKILNYFDNEKSFQVYEEFFSGVETKHGLTTVKRDFGSFFTKLAHTLRPDTFCALDNPIKKYFKFEKESFIIAFYVISQAYIQFCNNNKSLISTLRQSFVQADKYSIMAHDRLTDLKLLDLIFWYRSNILTQGSL